MSKQKFFKCPECGGFPDEIVEKHFGLRIVKKWNGDKYEEVKRNGQEKTMECLECGAELVVDWKADAQPTQPTQSNGNDGLGAMA